MELKYKIHPDDPDRVIGYIDSQADGAIPNGTRVVKTEKSAGDAHDVGAVAVVLGSILITPEILAQVQKETGFTDEFDYFYFVEWEDGVGKPCGVRGDRIARIWWEEN